MKRALLSLVVLALTSHPAVAHPLDMGYLRIDAADDTISAVLEVDADVAAGLLGRSPGSLTTPVVRAHARALADASIGGAPIETEAGSCTWTTTSAELRGRTARIALGATCPRADGVLRWQLPFLETHVPSTFQVLVKARLGGRDQVAVLDARRTALALHATAPPVRFRDLVWTGVEHIGAAPAEWRDDEGWKLPDGIDHILFLVALMLAGGTLLRLVGITTGFTVGHSITLALSAMGITQPPASVIEPIIALSIAFAAAEACTGWFRAYRWQLAAGFGLVHGFGFASVLGELELSTGSMVEALLGYNLGVELGQVAIVLAIAPLVLLVYRRPRLRAVVIPAVAAVIFLAGMYWFVARVVAAL